DKGRRVQLLTEDRGTETLFLAGIAQQRKLQGLMSLGNVILCERRVVRGKTKLFPLKVEASVGRATRDLQTFHHLSYVLELSRNLAYDVPLEQNTFDLILAYLRYLEDVAADGFRLLTWQLAVFGSIGMSLSPWPCSVSGAVPNGFSLDHGGAVHLEHCANAHRVSPKALQSLDAAWQNKYERARADDMPELLGLFGNLWGAFLGRPLKSTAFLPTKSEGGHL
ncbi:MAG: DNA repair protein RecO C-terminal domain-containing protein, partial [Bradymonadia bacterium]